MLDTASLKGQMQPWYYRNAKSYNNELLTTAVNKEVENAQRQGTDYDFKAEYEKAAQKLGLFDPTGTIHLAADFTLSDRDRAVFENMDKEAKAQGMPQHIVDDAAMFFKMDGLLADNSGGLPLDTNYLQRMIDDFKRENSPVRNSNLNPASIQYFKDNFSRYTTGRPIVHAAAPTSATEVSSDAVIANLAGKYDVRNMGAPEMRDMAQKLYDAGTIDLTGLGILTMVPIEAVQSDNGIEYRPVQSNGEKFDYLSNIKDALNFVTSRGQEDEELEKVFDLLNRIAGADALHPAATFRSFPPPDAPILVKKAYETASSGMSSKQKAIAGMPFRAMEISANIKYDPQENPVGTYLPGEAGYRNVYDEPEFSYLRLVEQGLTMIEPHKNDSPEAYQIQKNFLELFKSKLQAYGIG
jgi:hypothetical protein